MPILHSLLIGINKYPDGKNAVKDLSGCRNDVVEMSRLLETLCDKSPALSCNQPRILRDHEATRNNVINKFREVLVSNPKPGDTALFYFVGHGSREKAPREFWPFFHSKRMQTLICYDSREDGSFDLADKELAILISEIPKDVHVLIILDCCYAGSGTRYQLDGLRTIEEKKTPRKIEDFLDGYYAKQLAETGEVYIPQSPHMLLAAANRKETAKEKSFDGKQRGVFSYFLQQHVEKLYPACTYQELFSKLIKRPSKLRQFQHPQIECFGDHSPFMQFLTGEIQATHHLARVYYQDMGLKIDAEEVGWNVELGDIHGIAYENLASYKLPIFANKNGAELRGIASLKSLGFQRSLIHTDGIEMDTKLDYWTLLPEKSQLTNMQSNGSKAYLSKIDLIKYKQDKYAHLLNLHSFPNDHQGEPDKNKLEIGISFTRNKRLIHELHYPMSGSWNSLQITLPTPIASSPGKPYISIKAQYSSTEQTKLYMALLSLSADGSIQTEFLDQEPQKNNFETPLVKAPLSLSREGKKEKKFFVLIASRKALEPHMLIQAGTKEFEAGSNNFSKTETHSKTLKPQSGSVVSNPSPTHKELDWIAKRIKVELIPI